VEGRRREEKRRRKRREELRFPGRQADKQTSKQASKQASKQTHKRLRQARRHACEAGGQSNNSIHRYAEAVSRSEHGWTDQHVGFCQDSSAILGIRASIMVLSTVSQSIGQSVSR
jgi:hypothetical protein